MAVEEWKKDIAKDYIKDNILLKKELNTTQGSILSEINNIMNEINSLKKFNILGPENTGDDNENTRGDKDDVLGLNNVMGILFNNQGNQRGEVGYELKKSANIFLSEEDKKSLDLLYESLKKAKTAEELRKELDDLHSDVEGNKDQNEEGKDDSNKDSNKEGNDKSNENSNENSTEETKSDSDTDTEGSTGTNQNIDISAEIDNASVEEIAHLGSNRSTRKPGERLKVDSEMRKKFLFPDGEPKNAAEMKNKYLSKITVPTIDKNGNEKNITLRVHKKLVDNYKAIFKELKDKGIKVDSSSTAAYNWRKIRKGDRLSDHSFGSAIDLNRSDNGGVYGKTDKTSDYFNDPKTTVEIFKKYGFARGGDWSAKYDDPMHFTYMGG